MSPTGIPVGAAVGPRTSGHSRSTTVPGGQPSPQLYSCIGRDRPGRPYMAYKRSGHTATLQRPTRPDQLVSDGRR
jgi:hypothetical protein